jgi:hypothetical protein
VYKSDLARYHVEKYIRKTICCGWYSYLLAFASHVILSSVDVAFTWVKRSQYSWRGHRISETGLAKRQGAPFEKIDISASCCDAYSLRQGRYI